MIDFVMGLYNLSFSQAIVRLNVDFGLGLTDRQPTPEDTARSRGMQRVRKARGARKVKIRSDQAALISAYQKAYRLITLHPDVPAAEKIRGILSEWENRIEAYEGL